MAGMIEKAGKFLEDKFFSSLVKRTRKSGKVAEELDPVKYQEIREEVLSQYRKHHLPEPKIYLIDSNKTTGESLPNAATSVFGGHVFVTPGFLKFREKYDSVIKEKHGGGVIEHTFAHEIGHIKNVPPLLRLSKMIYATVIPLASFILGLNENFRPFQKVTKNDTINTVLDYTLSSLAYSYAASIPLGLYSQHGEFRSDSFAAQHTSPEGYAATLQALASERKAIVAKTPKTPAATLKGIVHKILNPIGSHPPLEKRLDELAKLSQEPEHSGILKA